MSRRQSKRNSIESFGRRYKVERHMEGQHPARNRMERRSMVHGLSRGHRKYIHGMGAWAKKFIKDGEYGRH
jgi:hypothetical protein